MKKATLTFAFAVLTASTFSNNASAQNKPALVPQEKTQPVQIGQQAHTQPYQQFQQQQYIDPGFSQPAPKLGFQGQMIYGYGMKVVTANWGTVAHRIGLEHGDVIKRINGRMIRSQYDYDSALRDAAMYNNGRISLKIRNVRFDRGYGVSEFNFTNTVLDGFYGSPSGPVGPIGPRAAATASNG